MASRPPRRTVRREVFLPAELVARVDLILYDAAQGRVPYRAWADFLTPLIREELARLERASARLTPPNKETPP